MLAELAYKSQRRHPGGSQARAAAARVYLDEGGNKQLLGRAAIPADTDPVYEVVLFGATPTIVDRFTVGTVTHLPPGGGDMIVERAVLLTPGQRPEILWGWQPLAS